MIPNGASRTDDGKEAVHLPVLLEESLSILRPGRGGLYGDLTLGGGGHARAMLERSSPDGILLGLDRDPEVLNLARGALKAFERRLRIRHGNFSQAAELFEEYMGSVDGLIMDLGLSSYQLDIPARGFSIFKDGPLDFRMDTTQDFTARDLVNRGSREDLLHAVGTLGEEPRARAVVNAIEAERRLRPLLHTSDLRGLVEKVYRRKGGKIHPATRTFQGLRMWVNRELESLEQGLNAAFRLLKAGGRMAVISFHSGEDRIVKTFFKERKAKKEMQMLDRKPIRPRAREIRENRRSRSALLRAAVKQ